MDTVYNKGRLRQTLHYGLKKYNGGAFQLFSGLDPDDMVGSLSAILPDDAAAWAPLLRLDGFLCGSGGNVTAEEEKEVQYFVQDRERVSALLPHYAAETPREVYKRIRILKFPVKMEFDSRGMIETVLCGETTLLLDFHEKGKQKKGKADPTVYVL